MGIITVLTITRKRPALLERAIESLRKQTFEGTIIHKIYIDDCSQTLSFLENNYEQKECMKWFFVERTPEECSGPVRLAKLRSLAI